MQIVKNKTMASLIAFFLTLTMIASFAFVLPAFAVTPVEIESYWRISAAPSPIGVGQTTFITAWSSYLPNSRFDFWKNVMVTIEKPDGKIETRGPLTSDFNGAVYFGYVPDKTGIYKIYASFPGQWVNTTTYERWFKPTTTKIVEVIAQEDPILAEPELPLPTEYWARPINGELRVWYQIAGNWLLGKGDKDAVAFEGSGNWNPYTTAPNTGHIMWTKELLPGGIAGGTRGYGIAYYGGLNYEPMFRPPIIMNGILYYNTPAPPIYGFQAVDLRTGETLWYRNYTYELSMGQVFDYNSGNQHGAIPYLWARVGSTWHMHDASTGNYILSISNVPSGAIAMGENGEILVYTVNNAQGYVQLWNSSAIVALYGSTDSNSSSYYQWRPDGKRGQTINGTGGIQWKTQVPTVTGAGNSIQWYDPILGVIVTHQSQQKADEPFPTFVQTGYNSKTGAFLWSANRTNIGIMDYPVYIQPYSGVFVLPYREAKQWIAWDMLTGRELWRADTPEDDWGQYDVGGGFLADNGLFYAAGFAGIVTAYDIKSGEKVWAFDSGRSGLSTTYGSWAFYGASIIADGKIFICHNEHSPDQPLWRGMKLWAINASTGEGIWNISGAYQAGRNAMGALADGYLVTHNAMDNRIYCFGKGPSAVTVSASPKISINGNRVLIEGTVTDISSGTELDAIRKRFPSGVPAIADKYMTSWMEYVHMQFPRPTNATGVEVVLSVLDPNSNHYEVGRTTSDANGIFKLMFTPEVPGEYTVIAKFAGSEAYWPSLAQTAIGVSEAAPTASPYPAITLPPTEMYFAASTAAIIIAIVIVGMLLLRKKP